MSVFRRWDKEKSAYENALNIRNEAIGFHNFRNPELDSFKEWTKQGGEDVAKLIELKKFYKKCIHEMTDRISHYGSAIDCLDEALTRLIAGAAWNCGCDDGKEEAELNRKVEAGEYDHEEAS